MGGQVGSAPACYGSLLGTNPEVYQKYKNGRHKQRSDHHTLARQKNNLKNNMKNNWKEMMGSDR